MDQRGLSLVQMCADVPNQSVDCSGYGLVIFYRCEAAACGHDVLMCVWVRRVKQTETRGSVGGMDRRFCGFAVKKKKNPRSGSKTERNTKRRCALKALTCSGAHAPRRQAVWRGEAVEHADVLGRQELHELGVVEHFPPAVQDGRRLVRDVNDLPGDKRHRHSEDVLQKTRRCQSRSVLSREVCGAFYLLQVQPKSLCRSWIEHF